MMYSEYKTPKRRHSSLFQRMEEQIEKISRKLSAAKNSARKSSYQKIKSLRKEGKSQDRQKLKQNLFQTTYHKNMRKNIHFDENVEPSVIETVRIKHLPEQNIDNSPFKKTVNSKTLNRRINFVSTRQNQQERISKLEKQNEELSLQIRNLQSVCQDQSYRLGYSSAYFDDRSNKLVRQNQEHRKQNIYLKKLCQHYKSKSKKYKESLKKYTNRPGTESSSQSSKGR